MERKAERGIPFGLKKNETALIIDCDFEKWEYLLERAPCGVGIRTIDRRQFFWVVDRKLSRTEPHDCAVF